MAKHDDASHRGVSETEQPESVPGLPTDSGAGSSESPDALVLNSGSTKPAPTSEADGAENPDDAADEGDVAFEADVDHEGEDAPAKSPRSPVRLAAVLGLTMAVAVGALGGWLGFRNYQAQQVQHRRELLVQVGRQGALNLTTIDWQHAEADVQRILDSATGTFYDDFSKRSKPFVEVLKKAQSKSTGTVTEAGLESQSGDEAEVLVAMSVRTSTMGTDEQEPRHWRMRVTVQQVGNGAKVSNVAFVQ